MTHRLANNYAKNYCNRTLIVKVIVENVVTFFWGHGVVIYKNTVHNQSPGTPFNSQTVWNAEGKAFSKRIFWYACMGLLSLL